jgi:hypothetical protein
MRLLALLLLLAGGAVSVRPSLLASRFALSAPPGVDPSAVLAGFSRRVGAVMCVVALAIFLGQRLKETRAQHWLRAAAALASYLLLADSLRDWLVDDAAITFAYSENLVRGHGLVIHPTRLPEEAYSNTLWMLLLAAGRALGASVDGFAKVASLACGGGALLLALETDRRLSSGLEASRSLLVAVVTCTAPFLIWAASGLEHSLQALLLTSVAAWPLLSSRHVLLGGLSLSGLVLLRPETPLIVVMVTLIYMLEGGRVPPAALLRRFFGLWPVWTLPFAAFVGLLTFRVLYFGDVAPNPFYAKAGTATPVSLFNVFGRGWDYVFAWFSGSAAVVLVPLVLASQLRPLALGLRLALAMVGAQLFFVVYAGGDWMDGHRFIAPIIPLLAILAGAAHGGLAMSARQRQAVGLACAALLALGTTKQYLRFLVRPTSPYELVARVGAEFAALGDKLGLSAVKLAHHDAGGTTYKARIDVVDLAGLGNRAIAKNLRDADFITRYLVEEERPDFVFGSKYAFAAFETRFQERPEFLAAYLPLEFEGKAFMEADLSFVRRDHVREAPGLRVESADGAPAKLVVAR